MSTTMRGAPDHEGANLASDILSELGLGQILQELRRRINYDGDDWESLTLGEISRATYGERKPPITPA